MAKIQFFKPFDEISGKKEIEINVHHPITIKELLSNLVEKMPSFQTFLKKEDEEIVNCFVVLVRGDEILKLRDMVNEKDVIKVLPPISGG